MYPKGKTTSTGNTNRSRLGARARDDPMGAAEEILEAHRRHGGNAEAVAGELGVTLPTLRGITRALSRGKALPLFQGQRTMLFDTAAGKLPKGYRTLQESIVLVRVLTKDPEAATTPAPSAKKVRAALDTFVARGTATLGTLAASVALEGGRTLDQGLLSKFRAGKKDLGPALRRKIMAALTAHAAPMEPPG